METQHGVEPSAGLIGASGGGRWRIGGGQWRDGAGGRRGEAPNGIGSAEAASARPPRWGCGAEDAERNRRGGGPELQRAEEDPACRDVGFEPRTGTPRHGAAMPRGFTAPGPAVWQASEAPPPWVVPRRLARGIEAQAGARGTGTRALRPGVPGVSDLRRGTPGGRDTVRRRGEPRACDGTRQEPQETRREVGIGTGGRHPRAKPNVPGGHRVGKVQGLKGKVLRVGEGG